MVCVGWFERKICRSIANVNHVMMVVYVVSMGSKVVLYSVVCEVTAMRIV